VDFDYISFEDLCVFVMDVFGSRGRRVHSTDLEALGSRRFQNSRSGCLARVTTLCRATEALLEDARNVEEVSKKLLEVNEAFGRFEELELTTTIDITALTGDLEESQVKDAISKNIVRERIISIQIPASAGSTK